MSEPIARPTEADEMRAKAAGDKAEGPGAPAEPPREMARLRGGGAARATRADEHNYNKLVAIRRLWRDGKPESWGGGRALAEAGRMLRARKLSHIKAMILAAGTAKFGVHVSDLFERWEYALNPKRVGGLGDYTAPRDEGQFPKLVLSPYYQMFHDIRAVVLAGRDELAPTHAQRELNVAALMAYGILERARDYVETLGAPDDIEARNELFYARHKIRTAPDMHDKEIMSFIDEFMSCRLPNPELDAALDKDVDVFSAWARRNGDY